MNTVGSASQPPMSPSLGPVDPKSGQRSSEIDSKVSSTAWKVFLWMIGVPTFGIGAGIAWLAKKVVTWCISNYNQTSEKTKKAAEDVLGCVGPSSQPISSAAPVRGNAIQGCAGLKKYVDESINVPDMQEEDTVRTFLDRLKKNNPAAGSGNFCLIHKGKILGDDAIMGSLEASSLSLVQDGVEWKTFLDNCTIKVVLSVHMSTADIKEMIEEQTGKVVPDSMDFVPLTGEQMSMTRRFSGEGG